MSTPTTDTAVVLATRRSPLALAQTELIGGRLRGLGHAVELLPLTTTGDRWSAEGGEVPGKGVFVKELEQAVLNGEAHLAVHSAKDLPAEMPEGLGLLGVSDRADARDVVIGEEAGLMALPAATRVATGSPRRAAQIAEVRPDLDIIDIRGNVGTRLKKLEEGYAEAIVLAAAGLERLGLVDQPSVALPVDICTPAPGQGYLALQGRSDDMETRAIVERLTDPHDFTCLHVERQVLAELGGGCLSAIGAHCERHDIGFALTVYERPDGEREGTRVKVEGADAGTLASEAIARLRADD